MCAAANPANSVFAESDHSDVLWSDDRKPCAVHTLMMMVLFSVYGIQVCPFIETLTPLQLIAPLALTLFSIFVTRQWIRSAWLVTWSPTFLQSEVESITLLMPLLGGGGKLYRGGLNNISEDRIEGFDQASTK